MFTLPTDYDLDRLIEGAPERVLASDGQLTVLDRLLYYWAAKEFFSGEGTIVDAGALVGASTTVFAEGLLANPRARAAEPTIHVYDLFEDAADGYSAQLLKRWYKEEDDRSNPFSFLRHFLRNTADYQSFLQIHKGDITKNPYRDARGIEILSIDVAKTADLMLYCAKEFFPRLIPGKSIILHQDYIFPFQPWLIIAMEILADAIPKVYDVADHCSAVFVTRRPISAGEIEARLGPNGAAFYHLGNAKYLYQAIEKARFGFGRFVHTAALAFFYAEMGQRKTAIYVALRMLEEFDPTIAAIETAGLGWFLKDLGVDYTKRHRGGPQ